MNTGRGQRLIRSKKVTRNPAKDRVSAVTSGCACVETDGSLALWRDQIKGTQRRYESWIEIAGDKVTRSVALLFFVTFSYFVHVWRMYIILRDTRYEMFNTNDRTYVHTYVCICGIRVRSCSTRERSSSRLATVRGNAIWYKFSSPFTRATIRGFRKPEFRRVLRYERHNYEWWTFTTRSVPSLQRLTITNERYPRGNRDPAPPIERDYFLASELERIYIVGCLLFIGPRTKRIEPSVREILTKIRGYLEK